MGTPTPTTLDAIDAPWLTEALRASGAASPDASITGFARTDLGEGEGFVGDIARLELTYEAGTGPTSVKPSPLVMPRGAIVRGTPTRDCNRAVPKTMSHSGEVNPKFMFGSTK